MRYKNRIVAVLLSAIIALGMFPVFSFAAENNTALWSAFSSSLSEMVDKYESLSSDFASGDNETNRIIVKTDSDVALEDDQGAIAKVEGWNGLHILQYINTTATENALEYYNEQSYVEYAEKDIYLSFCSVDTTGYDEIEEPVEGPLSWGSGVIGLDDLNQEIIDSGIEIQDEVIVAVLDSGITADHIQFNSDGRILDGYDAFNINATVLTDYHNHGTHVSGIIHNSTLPNIKIKPYKVDRGSETDFVTVSSAYGNAIYQAIHDQVDVINISMNWSKFESAFIEEAINCAYENNIPVVVAAANDVLGESGNCADNIYPANNPRVITVASVDQIGRPLYYDTHNTNSSNYGECVDIAAPGYQIYSTFNEINQLGYKSGTSMATPYVSAVVATIKLLYPDITCDGVARIVSDLARVPSKEESGQEWNYLYGDGVLNCTGLLDLERSQTVSFDFTDSGKMVMSVPSIGVEIYYTTDGSTPVVGESNLYTEPIKTGSASVIKAIAYEEGKIISKVSVFYMKISVDTTIRYKGKEKIQFPKNFVVSRCTSNNEDVVTVSRDGTITGVSEGEARVTFTDINNRKVIVNVTVEYELWQLILIYFFWGFCWYI